MDALVIRSFLTRLAMHDTMAASIRNQAPRIRLFLDYAVLTGWDRVIDLIAGPGRVRFRVSDHCGRGVLGSPDCWCGHADFILKAA